MKNTLSALGAALALCAMAAPAAAQSGNSSDVSGASVTTSSIAGGVFAPGGAGRTSPAVQGAVESTAFGAFRSLRSGSVTGGGITFSGGGVEAVGAVMNSANPSPAVLAQVTWALNASGAPDKEVNALTNSIQGLLVNPSPKAVTNAINSFNGLVNVSKASFLAEPPSEFQAIYAVLSQIVVAGNAAAR